MPTIAVTTFLNGTSASLTVNSQSYVRDLCKEALKRHKAQFADIRSRKDITYNSIVAVVNLTKLKLLRRDSHIKRQVEADNLVWLVHSAEWDEFAQALNAKDNPTRNGKAVPYKYPSSLSSHQLVDFVKDFCMRNSIDKSHEHVLDPRIVTQLSCALTPPPAMAAAAVAVTNVTSSDPPSYSADDDYIAEVFVNEEDTKALVDGYFLSPARPIAAPHTPSSEGDEPLTPAPAGDSEVLTSPTVGEISAIENDMMGPPPPYAEDDDEEVLDAADTAEDSAVNAEPLKNFLEQSGPTVPDAEESVIEFLGSQEVVDDSRYDGSTVVDDARPGVIEATETSFTFDISDDDEEREASRSTGPAMDADNSSPVQESFLTNLDTIEAASNGAMESPEPPPAPSEEVQFSELPQRFEEGRPVNEVPDGDIDSFSTTASPCVDEVPCDTEPGLESGIVDSVAHTDPSHVLAVTSEDKKYDLTATVSHLTDLITDLSAKMSQNSTPMGSPSARRKSPLKASPNRYQSPSNIRNKLRNRILAKKLGHISSTENTPQSVGSMSTTSPLLSTPDAGVAVAAVTSAGITVDHETPVSEDSSQLARSPLTPVIAHSSSLPVTVHDIMSKERTLHFGDSAMTISANDKNLWQKKLGSSNALMRRRASMGSMPAAKVSINLSGIDSPRDDNTAASKSPLIEVDSERGDEPEQGKPFSQWADFSSPLQVPEISPGGSKRPEMPKLAIDSINSPPPPAAPSRNQSPDKLLVSSETQTEEAGSNPMDEFTLPPPRTSPSPSSGKKQRSPQIIGNVSPHGSTLSGTPRSPLHRARRMSSTDLRSPPISERSSFLFDNSTAPWSRSKSILMSSPRFERSPEKESPALNLQLKIPPRITPSEEEPNTARDRQIGKVRLPAAALFFSDFFYGTDLQYCRAMLNDQRPSTAENTLANEERKRLNAMITQRINDLENRLLSTRYVWPGTGTFDASAKCLGNSILSQCDDNLFGDPVAVSNKIHSMSVLARSGSLNSEKFKRSISKACGPSDSTDDVLVLWSCFQLFGKFDPGGDILVVNALSLPNILSMLQVSGVLPFFERKIKGQDGKTTVKRVFHKRYTLEWLSLEFQKTQPSNYAEISKSRKVRRMAETILLGPRSVLQVETRAPAATITPLVPGRMETHSYIEPAEYDPGTIIFDKYRSPAIMKAIQAAKMTTKISFYRFVQFIKNLSADPRYEEHIALMRKRREEAKLESKKIKKEKKMANICEPISARAIYEEGNVELDPCVDSSLEKNRRNSAGDCSLESAAFVAADEARSTSGDNNNPVGERIEAPIGRERGRARTISGSHSFTISDAEGESAESVSDFASERCSQYGPENDEEHPQGNNNAVINNASNMLEFIMLKLRVIISKVDIDHLHLRSTRLSTRNVAAREAVFGESKIRAATLHLGGGLSLADISGGILSLRGGALDDPEVCYSGVIRSFAFPVSLSLSPSRLWSDWEKNVVQLHQIYTFFAMCPDKSIDILHGNVLSHGRGGANMRYFLAIEQCRACLQTFGVLPTFIDTAAFFRLYRAVKRWEWAVGYSYLSEACPTTFENSASFSQFRDLTSMTLPGMNLSTSYPTAASSSKKPIKRIPFSPCRPPPAPGASPTRKPIVAERYPAPPKKKLNNVLVNVKIDGTQGTHNSGGSVREPVADQLYIHDCASTIGLFHLTFGGFIELLCRISLLIFGKMGNTNTGDLSSEDESVRGLDIKRCVHNLLRLMDESGGKEKLIKQDRKSVVVRNFVFK